MNHHTVSKNDLARFVYDTEGKEPEKQGLHPIRILGEYFGIAPYMNFPVPSDR
jgi:hypothetical protein